MAACRGDDGWQGRRRPVGSAAPALTPGRRALTNGNNGYEREEAEREAAGGKSTWGPPLASDFDWPNLARRGSVLASQMAIPLEKLLEKFFFFFARVTKIWLGEAIEEAIGYAIRIQSADTA